MGCWGFNTLCCFALEGALTWRESANLFAHSLEFKRSVGLEVSKLAVRNTSVVDDV